MVSVRIEWARWRGCWKNVTLFLYIRLVIPIRSVMQYTHIFPGLNTTITIKPHKNTIPSLPHLGEALSNLAITVPIPPISPPGSPDNDDDEKPHFIQDATVHSTHLQ